MEKEAFYINDDGSWDMSKSKWIVFDEGDKQSVDKPFTLIAPPQPNWKPSFNHSTQEWSETATDEEMFPPKTNYTEFEKLAQSLSDLEIKDMEKEIKLGELEKQNEELGQQLSDLEIQMLGGV